MGRAAIDKKKKLTHDLLSRSTISREPLEPLCAVQPVKQYFACFVQLLNEESILHLLAITEPACIGSAIKHFSRLQFNIQIRGEPPMKVQSR